MPLIRRKFRTSVSNHFRKGSTLKSEPKSKEKILIADDEPLFRQTTGELLEGAGYDCTCVSNANDAIEILQREPFNLILSDLNMPGNDQLELLHHGRQLAPRTPLIVITGVPSLPTAIESIRLGIADYLLKPVKFHVLLNSVQRVLSRSSQQAAGSAPRMDRTSKEIPRYPSLIGESSCMLEIFDIIDRISDSDANVVITGESGTGKEIVAKIIHENSARSANGFQVIDCTTIPDSLFESILFGHAKGAFTGAFQDQEGLLEKAHKGTVFLDEIGEMPKFQQAKLLRVIQEQTFNPVGKAVARQVDTRFLCATNRDLELEVKQGNFRRDLFYRLAVVHIDLPPLRERGDDIDLLAQHFVQHLQKDSSSPKQFTPHAIELLKAYNWPGNVRELRNVVERCLALCRETVIDARHLPSPLDPKSIGAAESELVQKSDPLENPATRSAVIDVAERQYFIDLLRRYGGNVTRAAVEAKMSRQGLHKLLRKHGIAASDFRQ